MPMVVLISNYKGTQGAKVFVGVPFAGAQFEVTLEHRSRKHVDLGIYQACSCR